MSAVIRPQIMPDYAKALMLVPMQQSDLDDVLRIEMAIYPHPWSRGNFLDSLQCAYECWVARDTSGDLVGYFLLMLAVDEAHLLNLSVRQDLHGRGIGRYLLGSIARIAHQHILASILLEVRPSNHRALAVYRRYGFELIGLRKNYYPAASGQREDAIVMRLSL